MIVELSALDIAGFRVFSTSANQLRSLISSVLLSGSKHTLLFANSNLVVQCRELSNWMNGGSVILVNDGIAMDIAAKLVHGKFFSQNLNGTDFTPFLLSGLDVKQRIFILGGEPSVAQEAAKVIERFGHEVVGCADGYGDLHNSNLCDRINLSEANIVLVALGNPRQENWIYSNRMNIDASLVIGVGALLDFLSNRIRRAPLLVRKVRCEWVFRLLLEPRRLFKRYTIDVVKFFWLVLRFSKRNTNR